jgi:hypothetical protein
MFILFGVFQSQSDCAAHVVVFIENRQLYFLFFRANLVVFLVGLQIKFNIDFHGPSQPAEEGRELILNMLELTMH